MPSQKIIFIGKMKGEVEMEQKSYFHRVQEQTATRFWINNVTREEAAWSIEEGAVGCTQNPSYVWKMLTHEKEKQYAGRVLGEIMARKANATPDDIQTELQRELVAEIAKAFWPLYESSGGKEGFVSIQGNPFKEDTESIIRFAEFNYNAGKNIMCKIPVTEEGLKAIEYIAAKGIPINATEVMSVRQAVDVCEIYEKATKGMKNKAPIYFSHITGIFDEYLLKIVRERQIEISPDALWQAGMAVAKKIYQIVQDRRYPVGFVGGGARGLHHFTEMVGAQACVTINWKGTADKLLENNPPVVQRFFMPVPDLVVDELSAKLEDFKKAYDMNGIMPKEYEGFGPVVLFRQSFEAAWKNANEYIAKQTFIS